MLLLGQLYMTASRYAVQSLQWRLYSDSIRFWGRVRPAILDVTSVANVLVPTERALVARELFAVAIALF